MREAQITISDEAFAEMGIDEFVSLATEAGIRNLEELACYGDSSVIQLDVDSRLDERRLDDLSYVTQWERVTDSAETAVYVIAFTAPALSDDAAEHAEDLVGVCDPDVEEHGVTMSLSGPQDAITGAIESYETEGVQPDLRKLGAYEARDQPLDELTERQREVIEIAFEMGYYEVPREVSADDIASELDIDPSTVTEHLQRAERNLLGNLLSGE